MGRRWIGNNYTPKKDRRKKTRLLQDPVFSEKVEKFRLLLSYTVNREEAQAIQEWHEENLSV